MPIVRHGQLWPPNKKENKMAKIAKVTRSSLGLRSALFDEIDALRDGTSNPQRASALSKLAVQIINTVNIEIEYQKHVATQPNANNGMKSTPILLG